MNKIMIITSTWTPLSRRQHAHSGWLPYRNYLHTATSTFSPLLAAELPKANGYYLLAFVPDNNNYQLVALQGLQPNVNLYLNAQGQWLAPYIPAWWRSHPLRLNGENTLCVDTNSEYFQTQVDEEGQRFFDSSGEPSKALQGVIRFQEQCQKNRLLTEKLVKELDEAGLVEEWSLGSLTQLFRINEAALKTLPGEMLAVLAKSGALAIAYAQLFSLGRLQDLEQRHQRYQQELAQQNTPNLDGLFGEGSDDDTLKFNF